MIEFLLSIFYFIVFCLLIKRLKLFSNSTVTANWFVALFGIKVIFSILLTAIYTHYYTNRSTADIFKYFDDSQIIYDALKTRPIDYFRIIIGWDNTTYFNEHYFSKMIFWVRPYSTDLVSDTHIIIRFNAFARLFSFGYFNVHNVFMNFIALMGIGFLFKTLKSFFNQKEKALFYCLSFIPSVLFWGSGLLKEGIILFALGLIVYTVFSSFSIKNSLLLVVGIILLLYTKFYLLVALFVPISGVFIFKITKIKPYLSFIMASLLFILFCWILTLINSNWDIIHQIAVKQQDFSRFVAEVETGSGFVIPELSNLSSILKNIPNALVNTTLRPYLWEINSPFELLSILENLLMITLLVTVIIFKKKLPDESKILWWFGFTFSLILLVLIGLTTPVFGAIVRYKLPALLFIFIILLLMLDVEKVKNKYPFLIKIL